VRVRSLTVRGRGSEARHLERPALSVKPRPRPHTRPRSLTSFRRNLPAGRGFASFRARFRLWAGAIEQEVPVIMADFTPPDGRHGGVTMDGAASSLSAERPRPPRTAGRPAYAGIDLGTSNCRLLIARPADDGFVVIDAFSRVVRLGEGLAQTGRLSDTAMDRALGALRVCADKLRRRNVRLARSVATEA